MEVGQDPNWGCSAKEKKYNESVVLNNKLEKMCKWSYNPGIFLYVLKKTTETSVRTLGVPAEILLTDF
jgi:hypothetical protein